MKNFFFKAFLAISLIFAAFSAIAQVESMNLRFVDINGGLHRNKVGAAAADQATRNAIGNANVQGVIGVQAAPVYIQQPVILQALPAGHVYRDCTPGEVLKRDGLMMLRGALAGVLIGDNSRSAGVGAGTGLLFSMAGECRVAVPQGVARTIESQGVSAGTRVCPADTSWKTLDWQGHPDHGKQLCLPSEEKLQEQKAAFNSQNVTPTARTCGEGTTWKTLDWPGHPQHGKQLCLPSDEKIAEQKAASRK
jgi:hypothetical protein